MFTATRWQAVTYLLGVCVFSIAFLVFLNSSISFVITTLIKQTTHVGDAVGTLGFADEIVALIACPFWGVLSDRLGVRTVCSLGYAIIGLALFLSVQATNVFPQLLLARLFFSIGGAATSTMVTAILPVMVAPGWHDEGVNSEATTSLVGNGHRTAPSISSEVTITPNSLGKRSNVRDPPTKASPTRLAGLVGLFTGCGALLALGIFLRLPELLQRSGIEAEQALVYSYYVVGILSLMLSLVCFIGLRRLQGENGKGWRALVNRKTKDISPDTRSEPSSFKSLFEAIRLGFKSPLLGLGYFGGFVARASSVGISLFIPLFVNAYYISSGNCDQVGHNPQDVKDHCRDAYVLAAELTGLSQLVALLCAPIFGFLADKYRGTNAPLLFAALAGVVGYVGLALLQNPKPSGKDGSLWILAVMAFLGFSQIGAIVCSLSLLGRGTLGLEGNATSCVSTERAGFPCTPNLHTVDVPNLPEPTEQASTEGEDEASPLMPLKATSITDLKGSIAGVYSVAGGIGILILTKVGGLMFDKVSSVAPFYMLASFNATLMVLGLVLALNRGLRLRMRSY